MPFKYTMLFNFLGQGWSETWYYNANVPFPVAQNSVFDNLMQSRGLLCGENVVAAGWRLSDVSNPRNTFVRLFGKVNNSGLLPDTATNAWLASVRGVNGVGRRQLWLRNVPDAWIAFDTTAEKFVPTGPLINALAGYTGTLVQPPWCIRTVQSLAASTTKARVTAVAAGPAGGTVLTVNLGGVPVGTSIVVSGFRGPLGFLNGTYDGNTGSTLGTTTLTLNHKGVTAADAAAYVGGAFARTLVFFYTSISTIDLVAPRERKVGRAFFVPRGRRSRR